jgi:hypothetical protein
MPCIGVCVPNLSLPLPYLLAQWGAVAQGPTCTPTPSTLQPYLSLVPSLSLCCPSTPMAWSVFLKRARLLPRPRQGDVVSILTVARVLPRQCSAPHHSKLARHRVVTAAGRADPFPFLPCNPRGSNLLKHTPSTQKHAGQPQSLSWALITLDARSNTFVCRQKTVTFPSFQPTPGITVTWAELCTPCRARCHRPAAQSRALVTRHDPVVCALGRPAWA